MNNLKNIESDLTNLANKEKAVHHLRFFRTGKGEYGEGDKFLGITVPQQRKLANKYNDINLKDLQKLIENDYHEYRLTALIILVNKYNRSKSEQEKQEIINFYLKNTKHINNWDLVDSSAEILGHHYGNNKPEVMLQLSKSSTLWEQRISIISTYYLIKQNQFDLTLEISQTLLQHDHDLSQKVVGWMLREVGKRDMDREIEFLDKNYKNMPRTMLRYAIEKFPEDLKTHYMKR